MTFLWKICAYVQLSGSQLHSKNYILSFVLCVVSPGDIVKNEATSQIYKQLIVVVVLFLLVMTIPNVTVSNNSFLCSTLRLLLLM
jgi:hypothetical protein